MLKQQYTDFQIQASRIKSDYEKGRTVSEDDAKNACSAYKDFVDGLANEYPDEDFSEQVTSYAYNPANIAIYIREIVADFSELILKAFRLMRENMKKQDTAENNSPKNELPSKIKETDLREAQYASKKRKTKESDGPTSVQEQNKTSRTNDQYKGKSNNLVVVKTTEQKYREEAQQRAAQNATKQATKSAEQSFESAPESAFAMSND